MTNPYDPNNADNNSSNGGYQPSDNSPYSYGAQDSGSQGYNTSSYGAPNANQSQFNATAKNVKSEGKGFFAALFDVNFDSFISLKFAKFIYILNLVVAGLYLLFFWVGPFIGLLSDGETVGAILWLLFMWIPMAIILLISIIGTRVFLEFVIATIKTAENTSKMVNNSSY